LLILLPYQLLVCSFANKSAIDSIVALNAMNKCTTAYNNHGPFPIWWSAVERKKKCTTHTNNTNVSFNWHDYNNRQWECDNDKGENRRENTDDDKVTLIDHHRNLFLASWNGSFEKDTILFI